MRDIVWVSPQGNKNKNWLIDWSIEFCLICEYVLYSVAAVSTKPLSAVNNSSGTANDAENANDADYDVDGDDDDDDDDDDSDDDFSCSDSDDSEVKRNKKKVPVKTGRGRGQAQKTDRNRATAGTKRT